MSTPLKLKRYSYHLPPRLLAKQPVTPRHNSKLLIYRTSDDKVIFDQFINLAKYLPPTSFLVMNNTKVLPARVKLTKPSSGQVTVLLLLNEWRTGDKLIKGLVDRKVIVGQKLFIAPQYWLTVVRQQANIFWFKPNIKIPTLVSLLPRYGVTPIPPYLKKTKLSEQALRQKYQSMFASQPASVAAPTASLHFTKPVFKRLAKQKIPRLFITLHVGLGTFALIDANNFKHKKLFKEYFTVDQLAVKKINCLKKNGQQLIAVGTTATRALESAAIFNHQIRAAHKATDLFIFPPYKFKIVDGLITNFHLPQSSLMLLVDAFLKHKKAPRSILDLYQLAIRKKFRFYSFGDAMLII